MIYVTPPADPAPPPAEPEPAPAPEPEVTAALTFAGSAARAHRRARACSAARRTADVQVNDPNVSRRHAEVRRDGSSFTLVDLDSTNGIEVAGRRLKRLELEDGTRFTLGSTEIVFSKESA